MIKAGCNNGCTSKYINAFNLSSTIETSPLQERYVLDEARDDIEPCLDNGLDGGKEKSEYMDKLERVLKMIEEEEG